MQLPKLQLQSIFPSRRILRSRFSFPRSKGWLVVTAIYNTGEREDIEDYTLTGTLAQGTAVIMVGYGGKTASFTVEVTQVKAI